VAEKRELVRIVWKPEGATVDFDYKSPGRGVYICPDQGCLETALKKNAIARGLKVKKADIVNGFAERQK
jgi:uncharacterized protein